MCTVVRCCFGGTNFEPYSTLGGSYVCKPEARKRVCGANNPASGKAVICMTNLWTMEEKTWLFGNISNWRPLNFKITDDSLASVLSKTVMTITDTLSVLMTKHPTTDHQKSVAHLIGQTTWRNGELDHLWSFHFGVKWGWTLIDWTGPNMTQSLVLGCWSPKW